MKLLIIGYGRHGKDTVAELLEELGWSYLSSSLHCAERAVRPAMEAIGIDYASTAECFADRANHRAFWKHAIAEYNTPKDRLIKEILSEADIYVGLRCRKEFEAGRHLFDKVIWVDRSVKLPPDPSCDLRPWDADMIVDNNSGLLQLRRAVTHLDHVLQILKGSKP